eukprot:GFUD01128833.1.p1 GENE.GFUD01128833.1~~GFUD01128833.1.p1  ORF type:complete len:954 (-),score=174.91 GFUD01128833.1:65-2926(-)
MSSPLKENRGDRYRMKRVITQLSLQKELPKEKESLINRIIQHLDDGDVDLAKRLIRNNYPEDDVKEELIRKIVNSRNNFAVTQLIEIMAEFLTPLDTVDGGTNGTDNNFNKPRLKQNIKVLRSAIIHATLNDDPETLEAILEVGEKSSKECFKKLIHNQGLSDENEKTSRMNPMIIACVQDFCRCVKLLYRNGFLVDLCKEDLKQIEYLITMDHVVANDWHLYYSLYLGSKHINIEAELGTKTMKRQTSFKKKLHQYVDPVDRYLKFLAFSSPIYISVTFVETECTNFVMDEKLLKLNDPIRKAFACATFAKYLSTTYVQQSNEYKKVGRACKEFTEDLLDQCEDMGEVKLILNYSNSEDVEQCENTNWNVALWEGHKEFVGHHYYQQFIWEKMTGDTFDWGNYFFFWKLLLIPAYLVLFLLYPFVIFLDFFREADILFVPPVIKETEQKKKTSVMMSSIVEITLHSLAGEDGRELVASEEYGYENQEGRVFGYFRERIHRPFFRIFVHIAIEAVFILSLIYSLVDPKDKKFTAETHFYDYLTYGLFMTFLFEDIVEVCRIKWKFFSSFWNSYSLFTHVLFAIGGVVQGYGFSIMDGEDARNLWGGNHPANVGATLFAIASTMAVVRTIRWFLLLRKVGPVIICVIRVLKDVVIVFILFIILYIGFSLAIYAMYKPFRNDKFHYPEQTMYSASETFSSLFWRFFDPGEAASVEIRRNFTNQEIEKILKEADPSLSDESIQNMTQTASFSSFDIQTREMIEEGTRSLEFSHFVGIAFWAVYQGIVAIILINILIALMNTTYTKISQVSDIEWKYSKSFMYAKFLPPQAALPPPFRWFYYLACLVRWLKNRRRSTPSQPRNVLEKQKYFELLRKLTKTKMQLDIEDSVEDDFDDLRKDFKNVVNKDVVKKLEFLEKKNEELSKNLLSCQQDNSLILNKLEKILLKLEDKQEESNA